MKRVLFYRAPLLSRLSVRLLLVAMMELTTEKNNKEIAKTP